jgi:hypothetical protein
MQERDLSLVRSIRNQPFLGEEGILDLKNVARLVYGLWITAKKISDSILEPIPSWFRGFPPIPIYYSKLLLSDLTGSSYRGREKLTTRHPQRQCYALLVK